MPAQAIVAPLSILSPWEAVWNCWPLPSPLQPRRRLRPWNYGNGIRRRSPWLIDEQSCASHAGSGDGTDVHAVLSVTHTTACENLVERTTHRLTSENLRKYHTLLHKQQHLINTGKASSTIKTRKKPSLMLSVIWGCVLPQYVWFNTRIFSYQLTSCQGIK